MAIERDADGTPNRRLRLGMVGGGQGAFIGGVHRIAARIDDHYELVAGALSADSDRALASGRELGIADERCYASYIEMARAESLREDGIDVVSIVTPNHVHYGPAKAFLEAGINIICDKPLTTNLNDARDLVSIVRKTGLVFGLTHNYTGYPMVRQAREMIAAGDLGDIRVVQAEYSQDWLTEKLEDSGQKQAAWRTDPARAGAGGCIGDIGTHAYNLACFISGLELDSLAADLTTFVDGRPLDDNVHIMLRFKGGARGMLWSSQVAPGNENALRMRVYGSKGGIEWEQEQPNHLHYTPFGEPTRLVTRAGAGAGDAAAYASRIPAGHPEGYLEGFATVYADVAEVITARLEGREPHEAALSYPSVEDGARGVKFIEAAVASSKNNAAWINTCLDI